MADIALIKSHLGSMIDQGAPEADIDAYLGTYGLTADSLKSGGAVVPAAPPGGAAFAAQRGENSAAAPTSNPVPDEYGRLPDQIAAGAQAFPGAVKQALYGGALGIGQRAEALGRVAGGSAPDYSTALQNVQDESKAFSDANPALAGGSRLLGGAIGATGLAKAGITVAPRIAEALPGLLGRLGGMGAEGAAYGAANEVGGTGPTDDKLAAARSGAETGGILGAFLPSAGYLAGTAYRELAPIVSPTLRGISRGANGLLSRMVGESTPGQLAELGSEASIGDLTPFNQGITAGVAAKQVPDAANPVVPWLKARDQAVPSRLDTVLRDNFGNPAAPEDVKGFIRSTRNAEAAANYPAALDNATPVDIKPVLDHIDAQLPNATGASRAALLDARRQLVQPPADPGAPPATMSPQQYRDWSAANQAFLSGDPVPVSNPRILHSLKQDISDNIDYGNDALGIKPGQFSREDAAYQGVRRNLNDILEAQVPGYADANAAYAAKSRTMDLIDQGGLILDKDKSTPWPTTFANKYENLAPEQQAAIRLGMRGDLEHTVGTRNNDLASLKADIGTPSDWNYQKLATAFGEQPTANMAQRLGAEQDMRNTYALAAQGSRTTPLALGTKAVDDAGQIIPTIPTNLTWPGALAHGGQAVARKAGTAISGASGDVTREGLSKVLTASPEVRDRVVQAILAAQGHRQATADAISGAIGSRPAVAGLLSAPQADPRRRPLYAGLLGR